MRHSVFSLVILAGAALPAYADFKISSKYTAEGQTTETTTYAKGERLRYQYAGGVTLLRDCAQKRITQLDDKNKTFVSLSEEQSSKTVLNITLSDSDEQKQIFDFTAHRVKSSVASDGGAMRVETDGWYISTKDLPSCAAPGSYPLSYTVTNYKDGQQTPATVVMEVTELARAPLDDALFEVPAGYTDAGKSGQAAHKQPGAIRVAAPLIQNKSGRPVSPAAQDRMIAQMREGGLDVLPLAESKPEAVGKRASDAQCDYILYA